MIIALEEHYFDPDWNNHFDPVHHAARPANALIKRMEDLGAAASGRWTRPGSIYR